MENYPGDDMRGGDGTAQSIVPLTTKWIITYVGAAAFGVSGGFTAYFIAGNLEDWAFYAIRSRVTGKSVMSEIVDHPADKWVIPLLLILFPLTGGLLGVLTAWLLPLVRNMKTIRDSKETGNSKGEK
jgi:hypothetical protein